ncbi:MAG: hypothetical protein HY890_07145 [Deltaproteobacteria bacterium]|nr:hypothetical protein [Deltaproteobacteria bacterium]
MRSFLKGVLAVALAAFFFGGCSMLPSTQRVAPTGEGAAGLKKIAVLPFNNLSGRKDAGRIFTDTYVTEIFRSGRYRVEETGNILQFMIQERIDTIGEMELERISILGKRLKADGVLVGAVEEFDDGRSGGGVPTVSVSARLIDSATGRVVWSEQWRRRGDEYIIIFDIGAVRSVTALAQKVVREMIETIKW